MTRQRPVILLLSASRRVVDKARGLGLDVVHVEAPTMSHPELARLCLRSVRADLLDVPGAVALGRALHEEFGFAGVLSNHEPACAAAEAIALDLGLTAPGDGVAALLRDKARVREVLDTSAELRTPWARVRSARDVLEAADATGYPLVLKPTDGSASLGVVRVDGPQEVAAAWERVRGTLRNEHRYHEVLPVTGYLAEPFADGREYSVETFSRDGRHEVRAVVRKVTDASFVEIGHIVPADLDDGLRDAVTSRVTAFLDHVGLREGPAHTEVIAGPGGVHLVESHARTGGDGIPALVDLVSGRDVETDMIAHFAGLPLPPRRAPEAAAAVKLYLVAETAGRVRAVEGRDEALALPGVHSAEVWVGAGDEVRPVAASWDRLGELVAVGPTAQAAWSTAERARRLLTIRMEEE